MTVIISLLKDICISAVKEKDIEAKLKNVINEWSAHVFNFAQFKTRGELLLKGSDTSEKIALMEDSLMVLGSIMSNRYMTNFYYLTPVYVSTQTWYIYCPTKISSQFSCLL